MKSLLEIWDAKIENHGVFFRFRLFWWSFRSNPKDVYYLIKNDLRNKECSKEVFDDFIKIYDNRLDMSKTLLNDLSIIFSAIFVSLTALATILTINAKSTNLLNMIISQPVIAGLTIFLLICILLLLIWIGHIRTQIYVWASFKEFAFIIQSEQRLESQE